MTTAGKKGDHGGEELCSLVFERADNGGPRGSRYQRDDSGFDRAVGFFDATYALALTLLVTTLDVGDERRSGPTSGRSTTRSARNSSHS